ncbi:hypothetical protein ACO0RG_002177 [Hanseniaspora osmophila]|uniref:Mitochondrial import inner membrane translocase subunit n=1 Tax=Hanseniaspora osmophila TaxID=56408 RepID=A0A1E5RGQ7_9ASCO|nr:Mitochondrial import inner membrane translocase subunit TIM13 [Hanseniaspora osmophila]
MAFSLFGGNSSNANSQQQIIQQSKNQPDPSNAGTVNEIKQQIQQDLAVANATELVNQATENCFNLCMKAPYNENLAESNQCVETCLGKYMRSWNAISQAYVQRLQNTPDV